MHVHPIELPWFHKVLLITSHHITSRRVASRHVTSRHVTSRHITSRRITSRHITSHHVTSRHVAYILSRLIAGHFILTAHYIWTPRSSKLRSVVSFLMAAAEGAFDMYSTWPLWSTSFVIQQLAASKDDHLPILYPLISSPSHLIDQSSSRWIHCIALHCNNDWLVSTDIIAW